MSLHIEESTQEDVAILTLKGQITFGDAHGDAVNSFFPERRSKRFDFLTLSGK